MDSMILPVVAVVSVFSFVAVAAWGDSRRREREAFHRHETYRKMLDQGTSAEEVLGAMAREDRQQQERSIGGIKLGALITTAVGVGLMVFLYFLLRERARDVPVFLVGLVPLGVGLAMGYYAFVLAPRDERDARE